MGLKFKRQKPLGPYIVDFICHECNLIIEADGGQHQENAEYDRSWDMWLQEQGYTVLRFWNHEVMQEIEGVLEAIRLAAQGAPDPAALSPAPLPQAGEGSKMDSFGAVF